MAVPLTSPAGKARPPAVSDPSRYAPLTPIARGGSAIVWKAIDLRLGRVVALKRLHSELVDDPLALARFEHEVATAAALTHPGIVTVLDAGDDEAGPFMVMELIAGEPLSALMVREAPLAPSRAVAIVTEVAAALGAAHAAGIVHRDVKPANILIEDETARVVLTDFGIATSPDPASGLTRAGQVVGTVDYMAPERVMGSLGTPASDIYSLGVILYEMLTGTAPFAGDTPLAVAVAHQISEPRCPAALAPVPSDLAAVVRRALSKEPHDRPASAEDLVAALHGALAPQPVRRRMRLPSLAARPTRATAGAWAAIGSMATYLLLRLVG